MNLLDIAQMTAEEQRQFHACSNEYLGQQIAAQKRRRTIRAETDKLELGEKNDQRDKY